MYEIGQKVKVKSWEQMEKEYGSAFGAINTPSSFTDEMRRFCGMIFTISYVDQDHKAYGVEVKNNAALNEDLERYSWDEEMLMPTKLGNIIRERIKNVQILRQEKQFYRNI